MGPPAVDPSADKSAASIGEPDGFGRTIATGHANRVAWRLFVLSSTEGEFPMEFLCLHAAGSDRGCEGTFSSSGSPSGPQAGPLDFPTVTDGSPVFVYGAIGTQVARVRVELGSGERVEAEIAGEQRTHYLAMLPLRTSPVWVVAYSSDGKELARRGPDGEEFEEATDSWERCRNTKRGRTCQGGAQISGSGSGSTGMRCTKTDSGEFVCEDVERE